MYIAAITKHNIVIAALCCLYNYNWKFCKNAKPHIFMMSTTYILTARLQTVNVLSIFYTNYSAGTHFGSCGIHLPSVQVIRVDPTRKCPLLQVTTKIFWPLTEKTCPFAGRGHTFSETDNNNKVLPLLQ